MTDIDLIKQALEALEANQPINYCVNNNGEKFPMFSNDPLRQERNEKAIAALKERLAQPAQQKKVWTFWDLSGGDITDAIKAKLKEKNNG